MGNAGSARGSFRTAIRTGSYELAKTVARDVPHLGASEALQLVQLAAEKESDQDRYERMVLRWLGMALEEGWRLGAIEGAMADLRTRRALKRRKPSPGGEGLPIGSARGG